VEEALALNQYQGSWCGSHKARCLFEESAIDQRVDEIANCLALDEDALADAEITLPSAVRKSLNVSSRPSIDALVAKTPN
jgi:hypothetical protein